MKISGTIIKLSIFTVVMIFFTSCVIIVFSQVRFSSERVYRGEFSDASGLKAGEFVRIAGVEVGKVQSVQVAAQDRALVTFGLYRNAPITVSTRLAVRWENLVGAHYLELVDAPGPTTPQPEGQTIPVSRTASALDLDVLVNGFRPLLKALTPDEVNKLSSSLVAVLQGEGDTISGLLQESGRLTSTLADRDQLIGSVIHNLNVVLGTVDKRNTQFDQGIDNLQKLLTGLAAQSVPIGNALVDVNNASRSIGDLLAQTRDSIKSDVAETGRISSAVNSDDKYVDWALRDLPDAYNRLSRLGLYGDFFTFYLCDVQLKVNGPDGNPVYIPIIGQRAGRCTAR
jgi:phospholipid/cholesterol/gamma-HCH transport system substrate-binding protein